MITMNNDNFFFLKQFPFHSQRNKKGEAVIIAAFKNPIGEERWYAIECEKIEDDYVFYGYCYLLKKWLWGAFSLQHLQSIKLPYGFRLEIDNTLSLKELNQVLKRNPNN